MKLINISETHCELMAQMHSKCCEKSWKEEEFQKLLSNKFNQATMAAEEEGEEMRPLGFILYQQLEKDCEILTICVLEEHRKKGVGTALIESLDGDKIFLEVSENNLPAVNLYEKMGFEIESTRENYYSDGDSALVMTLKSNHEKKE